MEGSPFVLKQRDRCEVKEILDTQLMGTRLEQLWVVLKHFSPCFVEMVSTVHLRYYCHLAAKQYDLDVPIDSWTCKQ